MKTPHHPLLKWLKKAAKKVNLSSKDLQSSREIFYIEDKYYPEMNALIKDNYERISEFFLKESKVFIYFPLKVEDMKELLIYRYPDITAGELDQQFDEIDFQYIYKSIFKTTKLKADKGEFCGFLEKSGQSIYLEPFKFYSFLHINDENTFWVLFKRHFIPEPIVLSEPKSRGVLKLYLERDEEEDEKEDDDGIDEILGVKPIVYRSDKDFSYEAYKLIDEIKEKIRDLDKLGISFATLQQLLLPERPKRLSRIIITKKHKIFLPAYNNIEIKMAPLPKAVFFLFLKHPEGIMFKYLSDYKEELTAIYKQISNRDDIGKMANSIAQITDPLSNSINEKCSRIREAFVTHFDDEIAKYYYVTGERSSPKKIIINRNLVTWE